MKKAKRVLVLGPPSTIIEAGLREKFKRFMEDANLISKLPPKYRNMPVTIMDETKPAEDYSIMIENINAIYNKDVQRHRGHALFPGGRGSCAVRRGPPRL